MSYKSNTGSSKRKINPVDAVIAIVFLLALAATVYLTVSLAFADPNADDGTGSPVEYRMCVKSVDVERYGITLNEQAGTVECDFLKIGDTLYSDDGTAVIGKLASIQYEPSTASTGISDEEGNLIYAECPGKVDLILTVRGELAEDALTVGDLKLRIGKLISFHTASYFAEGEILSINTEVE